MSWLFPVNTDSTLLDKVKVTFGPTVPARLAEGEDVVQGWLGIPRKKRRRPSPRELQAIGEKIMGVRP